MNDSIKSFAIGLMVSVGMYGLLFTPLLHPDPFGIALAPIGIAAGLAVLALVLVATWGCQRWLPKMRGPISAGVAVFLVLGVFTIVDRLLESRWFGDGFRFFGLYTLMICTPALAFLITRLAKKRPPDFETETARGSGR